MSDKVPVLVDNKRKDLGAKIDQITKHYNKCSVIILIRKTKFTKQEDQNKQTENLLPC